MPKIKCSVLGKLIYESGERHHTPKYPYMIIAEKRDGEILICHYSVKDQHITHSIGVKKGDLERILKNFKKSNQSKK